MRKINSLYDGDVFSDVAHQIKPADRANLVWKMNKKTSKLLRKMKFSDGNSVLSARGLTNDKLNASLLNIPIRYSQVEDNVVFCFVKHSCVTTVHISKQLDSVMPEDLCDLELDAIVDMVDMDNDGHLWVYTNQLSFRIPSHLPSPGVNTRLTGTLAKFSSGEFEYEADINTSIYSVRRLGFLGRLLKGGL